MASALRRWKASRSVYLLYQYKSTNTDAEGAAEVDGRRVVHDGYIGIVRVMGQASLFPCFAGAKALQKYNKYKKYYKYGRRRR